MRRKFSAFSFTLLVGIFLLIISFTPVTAQSASLSANPTTVASGQQVSVSWNNPEPTGNDWISLHPADQPDSVYLDWQSSNGNSGTDIFTAPIQLGSYEFRLFRNGGKVATSNIFQVVTDITPPPSPIQPPINEGYHPVVSGPSITPSGDCRWDLWFHLSGFTPNSEITVSSIYSATNCAGQSSNDPWSGIVGTTDGNGNYDYGVVHNDVGTYTYTFSDQAGNSVVVSFTTTFNSGTNSEIIVPSNPSGTGQTDGNQPSPSASTPECFQSVGNDLVIGGYGRVRLDSTSATLRVSPSISGNFIESVSTGTTFTVIDGAVCADNYWWWKIDVNGKSGWAAGHLLESVTATQAEQPLSTLAPLYPDAQSGDGIHFGNYCRDKYQATDYREEGNARSWSCMKDGNRIQLDLNQVCREVWGDARPYINVPNESDIRGLTCQAQLQTNPPPDKPQPISTNPKQCYAAQEDRTPGDTTVLRGTVFTFHWRVRCDDGENNGLPRAVKIEIDGISYAEIAANEQAYIWNTANISLGVHTVCFMGASHGDEGWQKAARSCWVYQILDQLPQQSPTSTVLCPNAPATQLSLGMIAVIATRNNQNVRSQAGLSYSVLYSLAPTTVFTIVSGPQCVDGYLWWEVGYNGQAGWIAEGKGTEYYILPNGAILQPSQIPESNGNILDNTAYILGNSSVPSGSYVYIPQGIKDLKLRQGNGLQYAIIGTVVENNYYQFVQATFGWIKIHTGVADGWVESQNVLVYFEQSNNTGIFSGLDLGVPPIVPEVPSPSETLVQPVQVNICDPNCDIEHGNWVQFFLPLNGYEPTSVQLHSITDRGTTLTWFTSYYGCEGVTPPKDMECIRFGLSHRLLNAIVRTHIISIDSLRKLDYWSATYKSG